MKLTQRLMTQSSKMFTVTTYKYLGVVLDQQLDFSLQVDYAVGKAKRAMAKVGSLIAGTRGIPADIGIQLYKSLVRPHLEYAFPVWTNIKDKDIDKLQCLRRVMGAKLHSSSAAREVISGVIPLRFRKRELCCREYVRIISQDDCSELVKLLKTSTRSGLRFCPLEYPGYEQGTGQRYCLKQVD